MAKSAEYGQVAADSLCASQFPLVQVLLNLAVHDRGHFEITLSKIDHQTYPALLRNFILFP
jgi:hypothetical protein